MEILKNTFDDFDLSITHCDITEMITEISRFLYHITLIHIITHILDKKDELFGQQLFRTLFITAIAVCFYHILFKKFMNTKLKFIQSTCDNYKKDNTNTNINKSQTDEQNNNKKNGN